jgi:hypothetical protein
MDGQSIYPQIAQIYADWGGAQNYQRHCERSEAIQSSVRRLWIASLRSQ